MMSRVHRNMNNIYMQSLIKTEAATRAFKMLFRNRLQQSADIPEKTVKKMLNILLSQHKESDTLWKIINLHSDNYFQLSVEKGDINKGYFFLGLEHHLGVEIKTKFQSCSSIFECDSFVEQVRLRSKVKICELCWLDDEMEELLTEERSAAIIEALELKTKKIPFYIKMNSSAHEKIL